MTADKVTLAFPTLTTYNVPVSPLTSTDPLPIVQDQAAQNGMACCGRCLGWEQHPAAPEPRLTGMCTSCVKQPSLPRRGLTLSLQTQDWHLSLHNILPKKQVLIYLGTMGHAGQSNNVVDGGSLGRVASVCQSDFWGCWRLRSAFGRSVTSA